MIPEYFLQGRTTMTSIPPSYPQKFNFYAPISVRYADLDPQRHVNNIAVLEYVETARTSYYQASGIWDGKTVENMGMVVASVKCDYVAPIQYGQAVRVGIMVSHLGGKSLHFRFQVEDAQGEAVFARGEVVMVAYDQQAGH
jgi:YbgC/YbaW family acyl-CoA thioester hydrolase